VKNDNSKSGEALAYANIKLTDDKEVALEAVKHNGLSLYQLSMRLKHDREVIREALKQNKHAITYVPKALQKEFK